MFNKLTLLLTKSQAIDSWLELSWCFRCDKICNSLQLMLSPCQMIQSMQCPGYNLYDSS
jgi:hypothetical protein